MKRKERISSFQLFYNNTYQTALNCYLQKTGDFINAEDFLVKIYKKVYAYFLKAKEEQLSGAEAYLQKCLYQSFQHYEKDAKMPPIYEEDCSLEELFEKEWLMDEKAVEKKMLRQEILMFVSHKPEIIQRIFANRFYFHKDPEEIAELVALSPQEVEHYLLNLLAELKEQVLIDYEQDVNK